ncbi:hypothetical protein SAMN05421642_109218 [Rhodococcoides kyotonense]|uniref:DUF7064 domain-containing protein n=1 Tax=Rhodococcoides kyotonense TaxID=398843 RepID=A0A239K1Z5_9NOCA|nr:hypothetical protein SAMN05421642_109218 [Rhodococcus kyotonensis]
MEQAQRFRESRNVLDVTRPKHRESVVWVVPSVREDVTAFAYTWVDAHGIAGAALTVFGHGVGEQIFEKVDGIEVAVDAGFDDYRVGPMRMSIDSDGMDSRVCFFGERVSIDLEFRGFHEPYRYGTHPQGCPSFFADDRLEQSGRASGVLRIDGVDLTFDTVCQRDHSWGERDWGAMHHMKWINALTDDGDAVHAVELFAFGTRHLRGYILRDDVLAPVGTLDLAYELDEEMLHRDIDATWVDGLDRRVDVQFTDGGPHFVWDVNPRLTLRDTAMKAVVDGKPAHAYVDMSWEPDYFDRHLGSGR